MAKITSGAERQDNLTRTNGYAMAHGVWLGIIGFLSIAAARIGVTSPIMNMAAMLLFALTPVVAMMLTLRFRHETILSEEGFAFMRGFLHTLLMGFYAAVWIALGVFVYMQYFDQGQLAADYAVVLQSPEGKALFEAFRSDPSAAASISDMSPSDFVASMESIKPAVWAAMPLYGAVVFGPIISAFIGLVAMRRPQFHAQ